jgi:hypothetical protein
LLSLGLGLNQCIQLMTVRPVSIKRFWIPAKIMPVDGQGLNHSNSAVWYLVSWSSANSVTPVLIAGT